MPDTGFPRPSFAPTPLLFPRLLAKLYLIPRYIVPCLASSWAYKLKNLYRSRAEARGAIVPHLPSRILPHKHVLIANPGWWSIFAGPPSRLPGAGEKKIYRAIAASGEMVVSRVEGSFTQQGRESAGKMKLMVHTQCGTVKEPNKIQRSR